MRWNPELRLFEATILLKQGSYRYTYATLNGTQLNIVELGSSRTKENQWYTGILFYRDPDLQYDQYPIHWESSTTTIVSRLI